MNCEQFELRWNELLDAQERHQPDPEFQEHLRQCVDCRSMVAAQEAVLDAIDAWPALEPPADLTEKILVQVRASRSPRRWMMLKIAAALTTAAAILVACWPALFSTENEIAAPQQAPSQQPDADLAVLPQAVASADSAINTPPISALAQEASARYQELAREARDWSDVSRWVSFDLPSSEAPGISASAADWMGEVTTGLEPLTQSTSATLRSLLYALPGEDSVTPSKERAS